MHVVVLKTSINQLVKILTYTQLNRVCQCAESDQNHVTKNKHRAILFIEVTFLNLQHKIQLTDTSVINYKTDNLLKTIGKLIF